MISIIICSRKPDIPDNLKSNIIDTIGADYELIVIDNSENKYSIFSAYNEGVRRAKFPYLCFMHEDILFHTEDWGVKVIEYFKDKTVGLIGVVGGHYMPECPASWWSTECRSGKILQGQFNDEKYTTEKFEWRRYKPDDSERVEVAVVDGLWFCIPKDLFLDIKFDEQVFSGFHCYDTDICYQISNTGCSVNVVFDILIEHKSYGNQDLSFYKERTKCFNKWAENLPLIKGTTLIDIDVTDRLQFVLELNKELHRRLKTEQELQNARKSKAYRLGSILLKPFKLLFRK